MAHNVLRKPAWFAEIASGAIAMGAVAVVLPGAAAANEPKSTEQAVMCEGKTMTKQSKSETVVHRSSGSDDASSTVTRGPHGEIIVTQSGPCNEAAVTQSGSDNRAIVSQTGAGNRVNVTQRPKAGDDS